MATNADIISVPTKYLTTKPGMMEFEKMILHKFNEYILEQNGGKARFYFKNFDEFKDIHDNSGEERRSLFQYLQHVEHEYIMDVITDEQLDLLISELDVKPIPIDRHFKNSQDKRDHMQFAITIEMNKILVYQPSARQCKLMDLEM